MLENEPDRIEKHVAALEIQASCAAFEKAFESDADKFANAHDEIIANSAAAREALKRIYAAPRRLVQFQDLEAMIFKVWKIPPASVTSDQARLAFYLLSCRSGGGVELDPLSAELLGIDYLSLAKHFWPTNSLRVQLQNSLNTDDSFDMRPQTVVEPSALAAEDEGKDRVCRQKRGPRRDTENYNRVKEIVEAVSQGRLLKKALEDVCDELDAQEIPHPRPWPRRGIKILNWADAAAIEPELAIKAIQYRLKPSAN